MAFSAGRVEVSLGARLEKRDFELYERKLKEVRQQVAKKEAFKAELGGRFDPKAFSAYQRELKRTESLTNEHVKAQGRLRTSFGALYGGGGAVFAAAGGLAALGLGLRSVVKANAEAEVSQRKMAAQLKAVGISYDAHAKQIDKVIQATSKLTGLDDEELQDAFTAVVRSTGSVNTALKDMSLVADLARAKHMDVAAAGQLVARVHAGNVRALKSLGIEFIASTKHVDELKKSTDKYTPAQLAAAKADDKRANSTRAIGLLQDRLKGQAEAYGKTQQGAFDRVNVAFENLRETIGAKLGPTITRAANGLAKFINQMQDGTGSGGDFVEFLKAVVVIFGRLFRMLRSVTDTLLGFYTTLYDGIGLFARLTSKIIPGNDAFGKLADRLQIASDRLNLIRKVIRPTGHAFDDLSGAVDNMNAHLGDGRGVKRFSGNLQAARRAARTNITGAVDDVHQGLNQIRSALSQNLKDLGVSGTLKPIGGLKLQGIGTSLSKAGGGWIGQRGMVGQDTVPAMLAPGEAVLNRHQQSIIETLLGEGFLDQLFARVNTPHYFQRGGVALNPAVATLAGKLDSMFGLVTTSTTGGTHAPGSYHYRGLAADVAGSPGNMNRASEWIKSSGTYRSLLEGIHNPNLAVKDGKIFSGAGPFGGVWANHANHIHVALQSLGAIGGGAAGGVAGIQVPRLAGARGALGAIAQAALVQGGRAANSRLSALVGSLGGGDVSDSGKTGQWGTQLSKSQLASLWVRAGGDRGRANLMAAIALAESGGWTRRPNATGSGAYGLWQILGQIVPGNLGSPLVNARNAVAKYESQGLDAWEAYTNGSYRQYLARGGHASKRKKPPRVTASDRARDYIRPLRALQSDRIDVYDADMTAVDDLNIRYGISERTYDLSDEELIRDDGSVDMQAVGHRARELAGLASLRARIVERIQDAIKIARRVIKTYTTIIVRLRNSLGHASKKDRAGVKGLISTYEGRLTEWRATLKDLTGDKLPNARLDYRELLKEGSAVLGTKAEPTDTGDTGGGDTGGTDTSGGDTDTTIAPPSAIDIAAGAAQEFASYLSGAQDLFRSFGANYLTRSSAGGIFNAPDVVTAVAGLRGFGATGGGGLGGVNGAPIIVVQDGGSFAQFASAPDDGPTFMSQVRFQVESAAG